MPRKTHREKILASIARHNGILTFDLLVKDARLRRDAVSKRVSDLKLDGEIQEKQGRYHIVPVLKRDEQSAKVKYKRFQLFLSKGCKKYGLSSEFINEFAKTYAEKTWQEDHNYLELCQSVATSFFSMKKDEVMTDGYGNTIKKCEISDENGLLHDTPSRVSLKTGVVELNVRIRLTSSNYSAILFWLVWSFEEFKVKNPLEADKRALEVCKRDSRFNFDKAKVNIKHHLLTNSEFNADRLAWLIIADTNQKREKVLI